MVKLGSVQKSLMGASLLLAAATATPAATVTSVLTVSVPASSNLNANLSNFSLNVASFNPAMGQLTDVSIAFALSAQDILTVNPTAIMDDNHNVIGYNTNAPYSVTLRDDSAQMALNTPSSGFPNLTSTGFYAYPSPPTFSPPYSNIAYTGTTPSTDTAVQIDNLNVSVNYNYDVPASGLGLLSGTTTTPVGFAVALSPVAFSQNNPYYNGVLGAGIGAVAGTATVTYTYLLLGDANGDNKVDLSDLNIVLNNLGTTNSAWSAGNFDGAATIDLTDLNDVLNNLGVSANSNAVAAAPEPASLGVLATSALLMLRRARRGAR